MKNEFSHAATAIIILTIHDWIFVYFQTKISTSYDYFTRTTQDPLKPIVWSHTMSKQGLLCQPVNFATVSPGLESEGEPVYFRNKFRLYNGDAKDWYVARR